ncbi:MAG: hypothetical protein NUW37_16810 [Planctomycetes bacterium]|nr:hypothetical protein [Planctomycetota bacterium]
MRTALLAILILGVATPAFAQLGRPRDRETTEDEVQRLREENERLRAENEQRRIENEALRRLLAQSEGTREPPQVPVYDSDARGRLEQIRRLVEEERLRRDRMAWRQERIDALQTELDALVQEQYEDATPLDRLLSEELRPRLGPQADNIDRMRRMMDGARAADELMGGNQPQEQRPEPTTPLGEIEQRARDTAEALSNRVLGGEPQPRRYREDQRQQQQNELPPLSQSEADQMREFLRDPSNQELADQIYETFRTNQDQMYDRMNSGVDDALGAIDQGLSDLERGTLGERLQEEFLRRMPQTPQQREEERQRLEEERRREAERQRERNPEEDF